MLFFEELLEENHDKHRGHHERQPLRVKGEEAAKRCPEHRAAEPIHTVEERNPHHVPAGIDPRRGLGREFERERFIAHPEDEIELLPAEPLEAIQHRKAVKEVPLLDHEGDKERRHRSEGGEQHRGSDEFERPPVNQPRHQSRVPDGEPVHMHIDTVRRAEEQVSRSDGQRHFRGRREGSED